MVHKHNDIESHEHSENDVGDVAITGRHHLHHKTSNRKKQETSPKGGVPSASEYLKQKYGGGRQVREKDDLDDLTPSSGSKVAYSLKNNGDITSDRHEKRPQKKASGNKIAPELAMSDEELLYVEADEDENLGEDFASTPWLPPSIEKAKKFKEREVYKGGDWRIDSIDLIKAADLGPGVTLYFQFVMTIAMCLLIMSILSLPSLIFVFSGTGVAVKDRDIFGLYKYTLGNLGYDPTSSTYQKDSRCISRQYAANTTCIHFSGNEFSLSGVTQVLTVMEILQNIVFLIAAIWLYRKVTTLQLNRSSLNFSTSDYSIMVTNISPDTTETDIVKHFNDLYRLDEVDWRNRPRLEESRPVVNIENTGNPLFEGTWVAECIVHKEIGSFIASFKAKEHLTQNLYKHRATMKMYAENTTHARGYNKKKYDKAFQKMVEAGALIDQLAANKIKDSNLKVLNNSAENSVLLATGHSNIYHSIDANAIAGFVTFEYAESFVRCLKDYNRYSSFPRSLFFPEKLKLKGRKIIVSKAPEPDQILWEHIEVSNKTKFLIRARTAVITFFLIVGCFIVILQASINKTRFSSKIPNSSLCQSTIPQLYLNNSITIALNTLNLIRPDSSNAASLDAHCNSIFPSSFYAIYSATHDFNAPSAKYDFSACSNTGICPVMNAKTFCPCVSTTSSISCNSASCSAVNGAGSCIHFPAADIGSCYCYKQLSTILTSYAPAEAFQQLRVQQSSSTCSEFFNNFSLSSGFTYMSIGIVVVVGALMRMYLKVLTRNECHTSLDHENGSLMIKIFVSNYITMAVIVLVAYGNIPGLPNALTYLYIFTGPYSDFNPDWYGNVGFYLMTTFIASSYSPLALALVKYYVLYPLARCYHYPKVRALSSQSIVMQHQLNYFEVGTEFEITEHTAQLLTYLFFAMTFAAGLPLMMPLCCLAYVVFFRVDKMLMCRFYKKPPHFGDGSIRLVVRCLPFAAILRLAFSCWIYSNSIIFPYDEIVSNAKAGDANADYDIGGRLRRPNVLPIFVILIIVMAGTFVAFAWKYLPIYWAYKLFQIFARSFCSSDADIYDNMKTDEVDPRQATVVSADSVHPWDLVKSGDPLRQQMAPFSGEYFRYLKHKAEIPNTCFQMCAYHGLTSLTEVEAEEGWMVAEMGEYVVKVKGWMSTQQRSDHTVASPGDWKRTYEVIADHRCNTYNIEKIPAYKLAMTGLREGINTILITQSQDNDLSGITSNKTLQDQFLESRRGAAARSPLSLKGAEGHSNALISPKKNVHSLVLPEENDEAGEEPSESVRNSSSYNLRDLELKPASESSQEDDSGKKDTPSAHLHSLHHNKQPLSSPHRHLDRPSPERKKTPKRLPREMAELDDDFNDGVPGLV